MAFKLIEAAVEVGRRYWVFEAIEHVIGQALFPIVGIDSDIQQSGVRQ